MSYAFRRAQVIGHPRKIWYSKCFKQAKEGAVDKVCAATFCEVCTQQRYSEQEKVPTQGVTAQAVCQKAAVEYT